MEATQAINVGVGYSDESDDEEAIQDVVAHLIEFDGKGETLKTHIIYKGSTTIGRDPLLNKIVLSASSVSSTHAQIDLEDGEFWIEDLSLNGTILDSKLIKKRRAYPLNNQCQVTFGDAVCRFVNLLNKDQSDSQKDDKLETSEKSLPQIDATIAYGADDENEIDDENVDSGSKENMQSLLATQYYEPADDEDEIDSVENGSNMTVEPTIPYKPDDDDEHSCVGETEIAENNKTKICLEPTIAYNFDEDSETDLSDTEGKQSKLNDSENKQSNSMVVKPTVPYDMSEDDDETTDDGEHANSNKKNNQVKPPQVCNPNGNSDNSEKDVKQRPKRRNLAQSDLDSDDEIEQNAKNNNSCENSERTESMIISKNDSIELLINNDQKELAATLPCEKADLGDADETRFKSSVLTDAEPPKIKDNETKNRDLDVDEPCNSSAVQDFTEDKNEDVCSSPLIEPNASISKKTDTPVNNTNDSGKISSFSASDTFDNPPDTESLSLGGSSKNLDIPTLPLNALGEPSISFPSLPMSDSLTADVCDSKHDNVLKSDSEFQESVETVTGEKDNQKKNVVSSKKRKHDEFVASKDSEQEPQIPISAVTKVKQKSVVRRSSKRNTAASKSKVSKSSSESSSSKRIPTKNKKYNVVSARSKEVVVPARSRRTRNQARSISKSNTVVPSTEIINKREKRATVKPKKTKTIIKTTKIELKGPEIESKLKSVKSSKVFKKSNKRKVQDAALNTFDEKIEVKNPKKLKIQLSSKEDSTIKSKKSKVITVKTKIDLKPKSLTKQLQKSNSSIILRRKHSQSESSISNTNAGISKEEKSSEFKSQYANVKILFTGLDPEKRDPLEKSAIEKLHGVIVTEMSSGVTHLVSDKVRRTGKFLSAMSMKGNRVIVSDQWVIDSIKQHKFIDETDYILHDRRAEKQYGFSLKSSLQTRQTDSGGPHLFSKYSIYVSPKVAKPSAKDLRVILSEAGGKILTQAPRKFNNITLIVSCVEDKQINIQLSRIGFAIYDREFILSGILSQSVDLTQNIIIQPKSTTRKAVKAKLKNQPVRKKRR